MDRTESRRKFRLGMSATSTRLLWMKLSASHLAKQCELELVRRRAVLCDKPEGRRWPYMRGVLPRLQNRYSG